MSSTTANAENSRFLRLPPEIRCRIYDYVFGSNLVRLKSYLHVKQRSKRVGYMISMCDCEYDHTQLSPRVREYEHQIYFEKVCTVPCRACEASNAQQTSALEGFSLPLLQVSRQIYHEAALKPFQQALFIFDFQESEAKEAGYGLPAFMNALVPAQVKAITRLRLLSASPRCIGFAKLSRLEGLKHLDRQLDFSFATTDHVSQKLEDFAADPIVRSLAKMNLKSSRIELGLDEPDFYDRKWAELQRNTLQSPTIDDAEVLEEVLKRTEITLLRPVG